MTSRKLTLTAFLAFAPVLVIGQGQPQQPQQPAPQQKPQAQIAAAGRGSGGIDPADLRKPLADIWPSYSGDYTGRRYSALKEIDHPMSRTSRSHGWRG